MLTDFILAFNKCNTDTRSEDNANIDDISNSFLGPDTERPFTLPI
jgi:hypothetical protein